MTEKNHVQTRETLKCLRTDLERQIARAREQVQYHQRELDEEKHRVHVLNVQIEHVALAEGTLRTLDESGITLKPKVTVETPKLRGDTGGSW